MAGQGSMGRAAGSQTRHPLVVNSLGLICQQTDMQVCQYEVLVWQAAIKVLRCNAPVWIGCRWSLSGISE